MEGFGDVARMQGRFQGTQLQVRGTALWPACMLAGKCTFLCPSGIMRAKGRQHSNVEGLAAWALPHMSLPGFLGCLAVPSEAGSTCVLAWVGDVDVLKQWK